MQAISLFSSSGIGDLGLHANKINTVIANEIVIDRANLFKYNFPETMVINEDIWQVKDEIVNYYNKNFAERLFLLIATPPCQGMSSNGMGKILNNLRKGLRVPFDKRNRLILPTIEIIEKLQPEWVILENVPNMMNTLIYDERGNLVNIIDYIFKKIGNNYVGNAAIIDVADYGVPQKRKRLVIVLSNNFVAKNFFYKHKTFFPNKTHSNNINDKLNPLVTVREALHNIPFLDAQHGFNSNIKFHPLHKVPILDSKKYFWVKNTLEGETAFNNQCVNALCMYSQNTRHGATKTATGINKYNNTTPLYCERCGDLLPRPYVEDKNKNTLRLMKGYVSAYKRMKWDEPASTLTQNFQFACSDNKIHPSQNRVLSIYEALVLQTITDYDYSFKVDNKLVRDGLIRETIGESVPPRMTDLICKHIIKISRGDMT